MDDQRSETRPPEQAQVTKFPWGTLVGNIVGIAGAHAAGYYAGGALANALAQSRVGARFAKLSPSAQKQILAQTVGAAGSIGAMATSLASLAGQLRVSEEVSRLENQRSKEREAGNVKVAALFDAYADALREMYL